MHKHEAHIMPRPVIWLPDPQKNRGTCEDYGKIVAILFFAIVHYDTILFNEDGVPFMCFQDRHAVITCETQVAFIEGKVSVRNIPEEIVSDISVNLKKDSESFAQASRYVRIDEPFHFIIEPGAYIIECQLDQVKQSTPSFQVDPSERKVVHFIFKNEN